VRALASPVRETPVARNLQPIGVSGHRLAQYFRTTRQGDLDRSLDQWLIKRQERAFATRVQQGAYPSVITLHSVGLATLVGLLMIIDLRELELVRAPLMLHLRRFMVLVWAGFWVSRQRCKPFVSLQCL